MERTIFARKVVMMRVLMVSILSSLFFLTGAGVAKGDTWTSTGNMDEARRDHTATLLSNGKVLIVGGGSTRAELYYPDTGSFNWVGDTHFNHGQVSTATRLLDGRVLIVGGTYAQIDAEIYDPATKTFSVTSELNIGRYGHTATLLPDGKVLIAAGLDASNKPQASAEIYNPLTEKFTLTKDLNVPRAGHTATLLPDGQVLIAGGFRPTLDCVDCPLVSAEIYNPTIGEFIQINNMKEARKWHTATLLQNGKVLIAGGMVTSAELYDPGTGTFTFTGDMSIQRSAHTATLLHNGQVLIAGGATYTNGTPVTTDSAELYDPVTASFITTAKMTTARQEHTATILNNGRVLVTGGFDGSTKTSSAELFDWISYQDIIYFFDSSVENGTLQGSGPGKSANGRLNALRNMFEVAGDLIEKDSKDSTVGACQQLMDAYKKTDGNPNPPDFVSGDAASYLASMIRDLMANLGCCPDLEGRWTSFSSSNGSTMVRGVLRITNIGTLDLADAIVDPGKQYFRVSFYLSSDSNLDITDELLYDQDVFALLKVGQTKYIGFNYTFNESQRGKYIIAVIDSENNFFECSDFVGPIPPLPPSAENPTSLPAYFPFPYGNTNINNIAVPAKPFLGAFPIP